MCNLREWDRNGHKIWYLIQLVCISPRAFIKPSVLLILKHRAAPDLGFDTAVSGTESRRQMSPLLSLQTSASEGGPAAAGPCPVLTPPSWQHVWDGGGHHVVFTPKAAAVSVPCSPLCCAGDPARCSSSLKSYPRAALHWKIKIKIKCWGFCIFTTCPHNLQKSWNILVKTQSPLQHGCSWVWKQFSTHEKLFRWPLPVLQMQHRDGFLPNWVVLWVRGTLTVVWVNAN